MRAMSAQQPGVMESQDEGTRAAERRQGGEIEITTVLQPAPVQVMTVNNIGRRSEIGRKVPGAWEVEIFPSHLTCIPSSRLSDHEPKGSLEVSDSAERPER